MKKPKRRPVAEPLPTLPVDALRAGLPIFWPIRRYIWDITEDVGPLEVIILNAVAKLGGPRGLHAYDEAIVELEAALVAIEAIRPEEGSAIFSRLWLLAEFLNDSAIDRVSDLLVSAGQTSQDWESVLYAAATLPAKLTDRFFDRPQFFALADTLPN